MRKRSAKPVEPPRETLGQRIAKLRTPKGTQKAFSVATGIPVGNIRNFEQDRVAPNIESLVTLAMALGVTMDALLKDVTFDPPAVKRRRGRPTNPA